MVIVLFDMSKMSTRTRVEWRRSTCSGVQIRWFCVVGFSWLQHARWKVYCGSKLVTMAYVSRVQKISFTIRPPWSDAHELQTNWSAFTAIGRHEQTSARTWIEGDWSSHCRSISTKAQIILDAVPILILSFPPSLRNLKIILWIEYS